MPPAVSAAVAIPSFASRDSRVRRDTSPAGPSGSRRAAVSGPSGSFALVIAAVPLQPMAGVRRVPRLADDQVAAHPAVHGHGPRDPVWAGAAGGGAQPQVGAGGGRSAEGKPDRGGPVPPPSWIPSGRPCL